MLEIQSLNFKYPNQENLVLNQLNWTQKQGEVFCLLGESGSGKSTLLRLIYGLHDCQSGSILFDGKKVKGKSEQLVAGHDDMKLVAQDFDLNPYFRVNEIVGQFVSNINKKDKNERVDEVLDALLLTEFKKLYPSELSGGQRQRVALARSLANRPKLLLLDEPFSNLDFNLKEDISRRLFSWTKANGISVIFSSHTAAESLAFSCKVLILRNGEILQNDTPEDCYYRPKNAYVSRLFNRINHWNSKETYDLFGMKIREDEMLLVYPEEIEFDESSNYHVRVKSIEFLGGFYRIFALKRNIPILFLCKRKLSLERLYGIRLKAYRVIS